MALSAKAPEFVPSFLEPPVQLENSQSSSSSLRSSGKPKKLKEQRTAPRRRRRNANPSSSVDDPSRLLLSKFNRNQSVDARSESDASEQSSNHSDFSTMTSLLGHFAPSQSKQSSSQSARLLSKFEDGEFVLGQFSSSWLDNVQNLYSSSQLVWTGSSFPFSAVGHSDSETIGELINLRSSPVEDLDVLDSHGEWMKLQYEWMLSKNRLIEENEYLAEELERKKWSTWAMHASEIERQRRIQVLKEIDAEQEWERLARRKWANESIERERNERIADQFVSTVSSTHWFNETISRFPEDYELVCPYYKKGCRVQCTRVSLPKHLEECAFCIESQPIGDSSVMKGVALEYEVVCPNSVLGCHYIGARKDLEEHLQHCQFCGLTKEQEQEERRLVKQHVILECEEERSRRVQDFVSRVGEGEERVDSDPGNPETTASRGGKRESSALHGLLQAQLHSVLRTVHNEIECMWNHFQFNLITFQKAVVDATVNKLQACISELWPFSKVQVFGSYATGIVGKSGDLDLVVCFSDEYQELLSVQGAIPLLHILANHLERRASGLLEIKNVFLHARIPVIKAQTIESVRFVNLNGEAVEFKLSVDISIDGPNHSGLATTELVKTLMTALPPLGPVALVLKEYLKCKSLGDSFTGGIPSYGVVLLLVLVMLRQIRNPNSRDFDFSVDSEGSGHASSLITSLDSSPEVAPSTSGCRILQSVQHSPKKVWRKKSSTPCSPTLLVGAASNTQIVAFGFSTPRRRKSLPSSGSALHEDHKRNGHLSPTTVTPISSVTKLKAEFALKGQICRIRNRKVTDSKRSVQSASWESINLQKDFGIKVAMKLLGDEFTINTQEDRPGDATDCSEKSAGVVCPTFAILLEHFLSTYGEHLQGGKHGFSVRDGGFRFDVHAGIGRPSHPQAGDPLLIEDPVNVMNNVAKNCYQAPFVQRCFIDAHERLKGIAVKHHSFPKPQRVVRDSKLRPEVDPEQKLYSVSLDTHRIERTESAGMTDEVSDGTIDRPKLESISLLCEIFCFTSDT